MDLSQRRPFAIGASIAVITGLAVGVVATRDESPATPPQPTGSPSRPTPPRTLPTHAQPTPPPTQSCLLPGSSVAGLATSVPRASGSIVLSVDQHTAAVTDSDADSVVLLAVESGNAQIATRFATREGPAQVLLSADGRAFVTERRSGSVSVYDPRSGRRLCTTRVASDPFAMALSPDGTTLYVTSAVSAKLTAIDTSTLRTKWTTDTQREPRAIALTRDGSRAVVSHIAGRPVTVFDVTSERPRALDVPDVPVPVESQRIAIPGPIASAARPSSPSSPLRGTHNGVAGSAKGSVGDKRMIAPRGFHPRFPVVEQAFATAQVRPVPSQAWSLAALQESNDMVVPFMVNRTGRELPPVVRVDRYGGGSVSEQRQNEKVTFAIGVFDPVNLQWKSFAMPNGVRRLARGGRGNVGSLRAMIASTTNAVRIPMASAIDPSTGALIVASLGTSEIAHINLPGRAPTTSGAASREIGASINGIGGIGTSSGIMAPRRSPPREHDARPGNIAPRPLNSGVSAEHATSVAQPSGVAVTSDGVVLVYSQFEHAVEVRKGETQTRVTVGNDTLPPDVARGRRLFYAANNPALSSGGLSCGGCHPDGRDDGLVWFLANGPRQTPTLAGRLVAPFNWTGTHRTIEGNVAQTITRLGGTGLPISDVDAIAAFVQRGIHAPTPEPPSTEPAAELVERGRAVFQGVGACAGCHDPARNFTDGQPHELGGLGSDERERMFDTPSLRYLRGSGPFFHDGRYQTLRELLTDARARMGTIGSLSMPDVDALEAYLLTL
jgi:YVTN family beta-propeller protein